MGCILSNPRRREQGLKGDQGNGQHLVSLTSTSYGLLHNLDSSAGDTFSNSSSVAHALNKFEKFELLTCSKPSHAELGEINLKRLRDQGDNYPTLSTQPNISEYLATTAAEPELIDVLFIMKDLQEEEEEEEEEKLVIRSSPKVESRRVEMADKSHFFFFPATAAAAAEEATDTTDCLWKTTMMMTTTMKRTKESFSGNIEDLRSRILPSLSSDAEVSRGGCCKLEINIKPANSKLLPWPITSAEEASLATDECSTPLFEPDLVEAYQRALDNSCSEEWLRTVGSGRRTCFGFSAISDSKHDFEHDRNDNPNTNPNPRHVSSQPRVEEEGVVLYTTSLQGIRKTFEDCNTLRTLVHTLGVMVRERDLSMHPPFRDQLASLLRGAPISLPQLFINGKCIGGAREAAWLNEQGKLAELVVGLPLRNSEQTVCDGCGGVQFIPCLECSGSCKILDEESNWVVRCPDCNENGLIQCLICA